MTDGRKINSLVAVFIAVLVSGCAAVGVSNPRGEDIIDIQDAFKKGDVRFQCGLSCAGRYGANRSDMKRMHDNGLWKDLFAKVTAIGFEIDQAYYYIGRVAEAEGNKEAAAEYYKQALGVRHKCNTSTCDGFVFPRDIEYRMRVVQGLVEEKIVQPTIPIQKATEPPSIANQQTLVPQSPPPPQTESERKQLEISNKITKKFDDFKKITNFEGPVESNGQCDSVFLRAWKADGEKEATYQIYVMDYYSGEWRFYSHAFDEDGNPLDFTQISRDVGSCSRYGGCSHYEHVGINVTRKYLEKRAERGVRFKVSGKAGEEICSLSSPYIKAMLAAIPSEANKPSALQSALLARTESNTDNRTPEQRYEGALIGGRLLCGASYLLSKKIEEAKQKGVKVDADSEKKADVQNCVKKQLAEFEIEYKKFLAMQKTKDAKSALTDHYIAGVLAIKATSPMIGESSESYKLRQEDNKRKADEKWVRFEMVK